MTSGTFDVSADIVIGKSTWTSTIQGPLTLSVTSSQATSATSTILTHVASTRSLVVGDVVTVSGHTGDAANVAMNQAFTVASITSSTIAVLTGTGMTTGTYNTGTISGAVAGTLSSATPARRLLTQANLVSKRYAHFTLKDSQTITENKGVAVIQGSSSAEGTLVTDLSSGIDVKTNGVLIEVTAGKFDAESAVLTIGSTATSNKPKTVQMSHTGVQLVNYDYGCRFSSNACGSSDFSAAGTDNLRDGADDTWGTCSDSRYIKVGERTYKSDANLRKQYM